MRLLRDINKKLFLFTDEEGDNIVNFIWDNYNHRLFCRTEEDPDYRLLESDSASAILLDGIFYLEDYLFLALYTGYEFDEFGKCRNKFLSQISEMFSYIGDSREDIIKIINGRE